MKPQDAQTAGESRSRPRVPEMIWFGCWLSAAAAMGAYFGRLRFGLEGALRQRLGESPGRNDLDSVVRGIERPGRSNFRAGAGCRPPRACRLQCRRDLVARDRSLLRRRARLDPHPTPRAEPEIRSGSGSRDAPACRSRACRSLIIARLSLAVIDERRLQNARTDENIPGHAQSLLDSDGMFSPDPVFMIGVDAGPSPLTRGPHGQS